MSNSNSSSNRLYVPEAGMVKKMCPVRTAKYERQSRTAVGHVQRVEYIATLSL